MQLSSVNIFMKKPIIILLLFPFPLLSQNSSDDKYTKIEPAEFIATYSLKDKRDSLNLDEVRNQEMWLLIGKNSSHFVSKLYYLDSRTSSKFKTRTEINNWAANRGPYQSRSLYDIYKNYPKGKITFTESSVSGPFRYEEDLDVFNWELTQDTAIVAGYLSRKATCNYGGRSWVAWFSTELPFNDGPYKFNGLPGLIVKIYDSRKHYVFELTGMNAAEPNLTITMRNYNYFETTRIKYIRIRESARNSIASMVKERGGDAYSQQYATKVMLSRNNHIELK